MEIKIEKNVPIPECGGALKRKSPFRVALEKMEVGDSFEYESPNYPKKDKVRSSVCYVQNNSKKKFRTLSTGGIKRRVWRVR
jgi:hypothetical protein